ncbi:MAG: acyl transferase domain-containing protein/NAD(P)-dependent dehydrogenase (short-subunit alcohol dehydrogenase family) [Colwellia sp.]|jgi:acyl transferase domain-containing protein/NAD(P)-dependent dehydrogenase (short-subunit alcohol dehydrogenase family)/NADPH:quinone reductase-like Zn-dependent oxidoreductase/acyl carrier protein
MMNRDVKIAIVGMACRLPGGANSPEKLWQMLIEGKDATVDIPSDRWSIKKFYDPDPLIPGKSYVKRGGFLQEKIDEFDANFFSMSPRESKTLDPQQRLLLELSWEVLEDAGIVPSSLKGSNTAVFMGGFMMDNQTQLMNAYNRQLIGAHTASSSTATMLANRISYVFDFQGQSVSIDTACSSSLVALHQSCEALKQGSTDLVLCGGVNIMLRPETMIAMCKGGFLAKDGRCKSFDARGDGYGRGEGGGIVLLKRLQDAERDGDVIQAVIAGTAVNQDGRSQSLTAPRQSSQRSLINKLYKAEGIAAENIQYVEAHGTGTRIGDLSEAHAIAKEIAHHRDGQSPLLIGSIKSNIGHLEAASGIAGLIKAVLVLKHQAVPANLHFKVPHPDIAFDQLGLKVVTKTTALEKTGDQCGVAINSFGYGGTNVHAVLFPATASNNNVSVVEGSRHRFIPLSAKTPTSLMRLMGQLKQFIEEDKHLSINDIAYTLACRREHHNCKLLLSVDSLDNLHQQLTESIHSTHALSTTEQSNNTQKKRVFVYSGMGAQSWGMAVELLETNTIAEAVLQQCDDIWLPLSGWSLFDLFVKKEVGAVAMTEPKYAQVANFVLQVMLTKVLYANGVKPDAIVGHSVGEITAAYVAGVLSLTEALRLTFIRSDLQQQLINQGMMIATILSEDQLQKYLTLIEPHTLSIAAINSATHITLAGTKKSITKLASLLDKLEVFYRLLSVDVAYHSQQMELIADEFDRRCQTIECAEATIPLYSTVTGKKVSEVMHDVEYWQKNMREPVLFQHVMKNMLNDGYQLFIELSAHPVLSAPIIEILQQHNIKAHYIPTLNRKKRDDESLHLSLSELYKQGCNLDWHHLTAQANVLSLLPYPWDRQNLWLESKQSRWDRLGVESEKRQHPLLEKLEDTALPTWQGELNIYQHSYLTDHKINGEMILPAAAYIDIAQYIIEQEGLLATIENFEFIHFLSISDTPILRVCADSNLHYLEFYSNNRHQDDSWVLNAKVALSAIQSPIKTAPLDRNQISFRQMTKLDVNAFYRKTFALGLQYGPNFKPILQAKYNKLEIISELELNLNPLDEFNDYCIHPVLLDGSLQTLLAWYVNSLAVNDACYVPKVIRQIRYHQNPGDRVWCHARIQHGAGDEINADIIIYNQQGEVCIEMFKLKLAKIKALSDEKITLSQYLYQSVWQSSRLQFKKIEQRFWIIFSTPSPLSAVLLDYVKKTKLPFVEVRHGSRFKQINEHTYQVARESKKDINRLFDKLNMGGLTTIIYLWGLDIHEHIDVPRISTGLTDTIDLVHILQAIDANIKDTPPNIILGLCNAHTVLHDDHVSSPGQMALIGLVQVLDVEYIDYNIKTLDLDDASSIHCIDEIMNDYSELHISYRQGQRFVNRIKSASEIPLYDDFNTRNITSEFREYKLLDDDAEIDIAHIVEINHATSKRKYIISGMINRRGKNVNSFNTGQKVITFTEKKIILPSIIVSSHTVVSSLQPYSWALSFNMAEWILAYIELVDLAKINNQSVILIHNAATDRQLVATQLALCLGATIFVTENSEEKINYLHSLGVEHVYRNDSMACLDAIEAYGDKVIDIIVADEIDVFISKSLLLIKNDGRLISFSFNRHSLSEASFLQQYYTSSNTEDDDLLKKIPVIINEIEDLLSGSLFFEAQVPFLKENIVDTASDTMTIDSLSNIDSESQDDIDRAVNQYRGILSTASYIITGGFSGFGLKTLRWLSEQGAKHIIVISRRGAHSNEAINVIDKMQLKGVTVWVVRQDISDLVSLSASLDAIIMQCPPVKGVFHAAAVLDDSSLKNVQKDNVENVFLSKAIGAWNLHYYFCEAQLDFFILYSSVVSMLGNAGQSAYAAANGYLEGLSSYRRSRNLSCLSIAWGGISDTGIIARNDKIASSLKRKGMTLLASNSVLKVIHSALLNDISHISVCHIDWSIWQSQMSPRRRQQLSLLLTPAKPINDEGTTDLDVFFAQLTGQERHIYLHDELVTLLSKILLLPPANIATDCPLVDLGLDSLTAMELSSGIVVLSGIKLRPSYFLRTVTVTCIVKKVLMELSVLSQIDVIV